jgi:hypothetical protein
MFLDHRGCLAGLSHDAALRASSPTHLLQDLKVARYCAGDAEDSETENLMLARIQVCEITPQ